MNSEERQKKLNSVKFIANMTSEEREAERLKKSKEAFSQCFINLDELEELDLGEPEFLPTNTWLDKYVGGFEKSEITGIYGPTKSGKSFVALYAALNASTTSKVLFISCENSLRLDNSRINMFKEKDVKYNFQLLNYDLTGLEYEEFFKRVKEIIEDFDLVVIDGWNYILPPEEEGGGLFKSGGEFIRELRRAARNTNTSVAITWQLSRGNKQKGVDELTSDDVAISIDVPRTCVTSFLVKAETVKVKGEEKDAWLIKHEYSRSKKAKTDRLLQLLKTEEGYRIWYYNGDN